MPKNWPDRFEALPTPPGHDAPTLFVRDAQTDGHFLVTQFPIVRDNSIASWELLVAMSDAEGDTGDGAAHFHLEEPDTAGDLSLQQGLRELARRLDHGYFTPPESPQA